ncbi:DgyrCDS11103 [Dimorphilus gyrociliatus]|uniref:DgyrCDS11103 n=1 Tax=Dimorphilus gyrociliatus TaxID=2664684 RepID=A0A7I8W3E4_9ANNE|nr:DgyrCDS11103 [Dimorphilus gyrociliatus]
MSLGERNHNVPLNIPLYAYKYPCSSRVKLTAIKKGIFYPTLPSFRNVDRDTHMNKLSDEHCQTSTKFVLPGKEQRKPYDILDRQNENPFKSFYTSNREINQTKENWSEFLERCPERFEIRLPELMENKADFHFCGYGVRYFSPGNLNSRFTLRETISGLCDVARCLNGICQDNQCVCNNCFIGTNCETYVNKFSPKFSQKSYKVNVASKGNFIKREVFQVFAEDNDKYICKDNQTPCTCANVDYYLVTNDKKNVFDIEKQTGIIFLKKDIILPIGQMFHLEVKASNANEWDNFDTAVVTLNIVEEDKKKKLNLKNSLFIDSSYESESFNVPINNMLPSLHSRTKRSVPTSPINPDNITLHLIKYGKYENVTELRPGSKITFQLAIHFPVYTTDLLVELFTPDNDTTIAKLCDVKVKTIGNKLIVDPQFNIPSNFKPIMESKDGTDEYDRAILNFGNVSCTGGGAASDNMIVIEWDVFLLNKPNSIINGSTYWISAGAEYNFETEVWVGQAAFTAVLDTHIPSILPTFNFTGPEFLEIGTSAKYVLDIYIPYAVTTVVLDVFAPMNHTDILSVCDIRVVSKGENYECLKTDHLNIEQYKSKTKITNEKARLNLGEIINKGAREDDNEIIKNRLTLEIVVHLQENNNFIGKNYWVLTPKVSLELLTPQNVFIGDSILHEMVVEYPKNSLSFYELEVILPFNQSQEWLKICSLKMVFSGKNLPCVTCHQHNNCPIEYSSRYNGKYHDKAVWKLGNILHTGHYEVDQFPESNKMKFLLTTQVLNHSLALSGTQIDLTLGFRFANNKLWVGKSEVFLSDNITRYNNNNTTPNFKTYFSTKNNTIAREETKSIQIDIETQEFSINYPMEIILSSPQISTIPILKICSFEVFFVGENIHCVSAKELSMKAIFFSSQNNDEYDNLKATFGSICNLKYNDFPKNTKKENKVLLAFTVKLQNYSNIMEGSSFDIDIKINYMWENSWTIKLPFIATLLNPHILDEKPKIFFDEKIHTLRRLSSIPYKFSMKIPTSSSSHLFLTLIASSTLSICNVRVLRVGSNFKCLNQLKFSYEKHTENYLQYDQTASLDMGIVSNTGFGNYSLNETFDENTIEFEAILSQIVFSQYGLDTNSFINVSLKYNGDNFIEEKSPIFNITPPMNKGKTQINYKITRSGFVNETEEDKYIQRGESFRTILEIYPEIDSDEELSVKFITPVNISNIIDICSAHIIFVGKNIPCLERLAIKPKFSSRNNSNVMDIVELKLGRVCRRNISMFEKDNVIKVEAIGRILKNSSADKFWFSSAIELNSEKLFLAQLALEVKQQSLNPTSNPNGGIKVNESSKAVYPSEIFLLPVIITLPENETFSLVTDIKTNLSDTATATVNWVKIMKIGKNIGCSISNNGEHNINVTSSNKNSQNDKLILDFGIVSNSGAGSRQQDTDSENNEIFLLYELQCADSVLNENRQKISILLGLKYGSVIKLTEHHLIIKRTNFENPKLSLELSSNSISELLNP